MIFPSDYESIDDLVVHLSEGSDGTCAVAGSVLTVTLNEDADFAGDSRGIVCEYVRPVADVIASFAVTAVDFGGDVGAGVYLALTGDYPNLLNPDDMAAIGVILGDSGNAIAAVSKLDGTASLSGVSLPALPVTLRIRRYGSRVFLDAVDGTDTTLLLREVEMPVGPMLCDLRLFVTGTGAAEVVGSGLSIEFESPLHGLIWNSLPPWLRTYPMRIGPDGSFVITTSGVTCLLQDVTHLLETPTGGLYHHPDIGAGVRQFFGKDGSAKTKNRLADAVATALTTEGVRGRLVARGSTVTVTALNEESIDIAIALAMQDGESVLTENLVLSFGIDGVTAVWSTT